MKKRVRVVSRAAIRRAGKFFDNQPPALRPATEDAVAAIHEAMHALQEEPFVLAALIGMIRGTIDGGWWVPRDGEIAFQLMSCTATAVAFVAHHAAEMKAAHGYMSTDSIVETAVRKAA